MLLKTKTESRLGKKAKRWSGLMGCTLPSTFETDHHRSWEGEWRSQLVFATDSQVNLKKKIFLSNIVTSQIIFFKMIYWENRFRSSWKLTSSSSSTSPDWLIFHLIRLSPKHGQSEAYTRHILLPLSATIFC